MKVFGRNHAVRLAFFEEGHMPTTGKLKKMFSSSSVQTYKGWGYFRYELYTLNHALRVAADVRGTTPNYTATSCEVAVLDETSQYNVFSAANHFGYLKATINWSPTSYDRLSDLLSTLNAVDQDQRLCGKFLDSADRLKELYKSQGITDLHLERFNSKAFESAYGQCGQQGFLELRQLIADEVSNLHWTAEVPLYTGSANDEKEPEAKAA
jgi:hypothetical protein